MAKEDKPITSKHKVELELWGFVDPSKKKPDSAEKRPLELASTDGELHSGFLLTGNVDLEKSELYDILRRENEENEYPLFILRLLPVKE